MAEEYRVKGSSIRSKFDFVRERFGTQAETTLRQQFAQHFGPGSILDSSWYPFALYDEVNCAIASKFFGGDRSRLVEVGAYSAEKVLTSTYKAFAKANDLPGLLERFASLHRLVYSEGEMTVSLASDGRSLTVLLSGAPLYSEADLQIATGFYVGAAKLLGFESVRSRPVLEKHSARVELSW